MLQHGINGAPRAGVCCQRSIAHAKKRKLADMLVPTNDHTRDVVMLGGSTNKFIQVLHDV